MQLSTVISREGALRVKLATTEQEVVELKVIENHLFQSDCVASSSESIGNNKSLEMSFSKIQERQYSIATLSAPTLWPHVFPQDSTILQRGRRANFLLPYRHGECDTNFMSIVWQNYHCFLLQTLLQLHLDSCSVHPIINFMQMSTFVCFWGHWDLDLYYYVYFQQITCIWSTSLYLKCNLSGFAQWCLLLDVASVIYITGRACGWLRSMQSAVCGLVRMTNPSKATTPSKQQVSSIYQLGFPSTV